MCVKRFFGLFLEIFTQGLNFHAHFNLHLIIHFYGIFCQFFAFLEIFTDTMKFSRMENQFFSRKGAVFSRRKKNTANLISFCFISHIRIIFGISICLLKSAFCDLWNFLLWRSGDEWVMGDGSWVRVCFFFCNISITQHFFPIVLPSLRKLFKTSFVKKSTTEKFNIQKISNKSGVGNFLDISRFEKSRIH